MLRTLTSLILALTSPTHAQFFTFHQIRAPASGVTPGSQTFTASGNFTVPAYNTLTVTMWGGGGGGGDSWDWDYDSAVSGTAGGASTFSGLSAGGGGGGTDGWYDSDTGGGNGTGGGGGVASGGTTNTNGSSGSAPTGAGAPGGGGASSGGTGNIPGGGGAGNSFYGYPGGGGGSGGYVTKTFTAGQLSVGASLPVVVGNGGVGGGNYPGFNGARGEVRITWN